MKLHFRGNGRQSKTNIWLFKLVRLVKVLHTCQFHANIPIVVQKINFVIAYSVFCQVLCRYFSNHRSFASETAETKTDNSFTRYPKLVLLS